MVARGHAAADLQIDKLVDITGLAALVSGIGLYQLLNQGAPAGRIVRIGNADLVERTAQAGQVLFQPERSAPVHRDHFIDPVAKNESSVEYADTCLAQWANLAVEVAGRVRQERKIRLGKHAEIIAVGSACVHRDHLIDPVAKNESSVEHADTRLAQWANLAVEVAGRIRQERKIRLGKHAEIIAEGSAEQTPFNNPGHRFGGAEGNLVQLFLLSGIIGM